MLKPGKDTRETFGSLIYIGRWTIIAIIVGLAVGLAAVIFTAALNWSIDILADLSETSFVFFMPAIGLFVSGFLTNTFAPEAAGHGTDAIIKSYNDNWGRVNVIVVPIKLIASVFTIAFGGSAGREGPTVQMGGGIGYFIGNKLGVSLKDMRKIVVCGMGASFGAIFTAPLAGGVFGAEVLYMDDVEYNTLFISFVSSITAFYVYAVILGQTRLFTFPIPDGYSFIPERDILLFVGIGILVGLVSLIYVKTLYGYEELNEKYELPQYVKTTIGGVLTGLTAVFVTPLVLGTGISLVEKISVQHDISTLFLLALLVGKILATSFTIGSGGSGGVVAPSLTIGALTGGIVSGLVNYPFPLAIVTACAVGGLGSAAHIPITTLIMAGEMFGVEMMKPAAIVTLTSAWVARSDTIYRESLVSRTELGKAAHSVKTGPE